MYSPDDEVLVDTGNNTRYTYKQLNNKANQIANFFQDKFSFTKGDRIAVLLNNSIEFVEIYIAGAKAGIVIVPINFRLTAHEGLYICQHSQAKALIFEKRYLDSIKQIWGDITNQFHTNIVIIEKDIEPTLKDYESFLNQSSLNPLELDISDEDPWVILYTSGTTGFPSHCSNSA